MKGLMIDCTGREIHRGDVIAVAYNNAHCFGIVERSEPGRLHFWRLDIWGHSNLHYRRTKTNLSPGSSHVGQVDYLASRPSSRSLLVSPDILDSGKRAMYDEMMKVF